MTNQITPTPLCTAPLYWQSEDSIEFVGSSTLVECKDASFLVTCGHCARFRGMQSHSLLVGGSKPFQILRPLLATSQHQDHDSPYRMIDLGIVRLTEAERQNLSCRFEFVPETAIEGSGGAFPFSNFAVVGYPGIEGVPNLFRKDTSSLTSNIACLPANLDQSFRCRAIDAEPSWFLRLEFSRYMPYLRNCGFKLRKLDGFSGGPILRSLKPDGWSLAGISVETTSPQRKKFTLIGISARAVKDVIVHWWDQLDQ